MMNHTNPPPQKGHLFLFEKDFLMENRQRKKKKWRSALRVALA